MTQSTLYQELLKHNTIPYNLNKVSAYIILVKKTKNARLAQQFKYRLYFLLSKIFIKAINNFTSLTKTLPDYKILHTREDIALECYMIFDTCLEKLRMEDINKFHYYLNTALNRGVYRIYENQYECYFNVIDTHDEDKGHLLLNTGYVQEIDFTDIDLKGLSPEEIAILKFRMSGERLSTFLKKEKMTTAVYNQIFDQAREKLFQIYQHENYFSEYLSTQYE